MHHHDLFMADGERDRRRARQAAAWMWTEVTEEVMDSLRGDRAIADLARSLEDDVIAGRLVPGAAARRLLAAWRRN
jgi:LAO/AO transport system kinase